VVTKEFCKTISATSLADLERYEAVVKLLVERIRNRSFNGFLSFCRYTRYTALSSRSPVRMRWASIRAWFSFADYIAFRYCRILSMIGTWIWRPFPAHQKCRLKQTRPVSNVQKFWRGSNFN